MGIIVSRDNSTSKFDGTLLGIDVGRLVGISVDEDSLGLPAEKKMKEDSNLTLLT